MLNRSLRSLSAPAVVGAALLAACDGDADASARTLADAPRPGIPVAAEVAAVAAPGSPYRPITVLNGGAVRGRVSGRGDPPRDSTVRVGADSAACGREVLEQTVGVRDGRVAGAVVWLAGVRTGRPLPLERRYELLTDHCRLLPRVQAAAVGGTVNVRTVDRVVHETRFVRQTGSATVLAHAHTNDDGQVVPLEQPLRAPGLVEARCARHPWARAWLFAFDHPYFATTGADGAFTLDGVPPGRYTLVVWHERGEIVRQPVVVAAGQTLDADVELAWAR